MGSHLCLNLTVELFVFSYSHCQAKQCLDCPCFADVAKSSSSSGSSSSHDMNEPRDIAREGAAEMDPAEGETDGDEGMALHARLDSR